MQWWWQEILEVKWEWETFCRSFCRCFWKLIVIQVYREQKKSFVSKESFLHQDWRRMWRGLTTQLRGKGILYYHLEYKGGELMIRAGGSDIYRSTGVCYQGNHVTKWRTWTGHKLDSNRLEKTAVQLEVYVCRTRQTEVQVRYTLYPSSS